MSKDNGVDFGSMYRHRFNSFKLEGVIRSINEKWGVCELEMDNGALFARVDDGHSIMIISQDRCLHSIDAFYDKCKGKTEDNEL